MGGNIVYLGVKGRVLAFDKQTDKKIWEAHLKSSGFVTLLIESDVILAHTHGHLYCLNKVNGHKLWENSLPGLGYGMATFATDGNNPDSTVQAQMLQMQQNQAAAASASSGAVASNS